MSTSEVISRATRATHPVTEVGDWFRVENKAGSTSAKVYLYDEIGIFGKSAKEFVDEINALDVRAIDFHIHSPGGSVFDGLAIMNSLRHHQARVVTTVDGVAASAASFIAMAGDEVVMARNSEMMIHDARGLVMGTASDMAELAGVLEKNSDNIAAIYAEKAGGTADEWRDRMRAETWYTAQEAVDAGLADRVEAAKSVEVTNRFDLSIFNYAGRAEAPPPPIDPPKTPAASADGPTEQKEHGMSSLMDSLRKELGIADDTADEATILAALKEALAERAEAAEAPPAPQASSNPEDIKRLAAAAGAVIVDRGVWEDAQNRIQEGVNAARKLREQERDTLLDKAVEDGRIPPANKDYWASLYDKDPKGTGDVIASLRKNLVPVQALGYALDDDDDDLGEFSALFPKER